MRAGLALALVVAAGCSKPESPECVQSVALYKQLQDESPLVDFAYSSPRYDSIVEVAHRESRATDACGMTRAYAKLIEDGRASHRPIAVQTPGRMAPPSAARPAFTVPLDWNPRGVFSAPTPAFEAPQAASMATPDPEIAAERERQDRTVRAAEEERARAQEQAVLQQQSIAPCTRDCDRLNNCVFTGSKGASSYSDLVCQNDKAACYARCQGQPTPVPFNDSSRWTPK